MSSNDKWMVVILAAVVAVLAIVESCRMRILDDRVRALEGTEIHGH